MGTVVKRHTKRKTGQRRSHHALKPTTTQKCAKCGTPTLPHRACIACGNYRGRTVKK